MQEQAVIDQALTILSSRLSTRTTSTLLTSPEDAINFLTLKLADEEREVFAVMFLNVRHQLIEYREMFFGTIDSASVHPREVAKAALQTNAAAVIIAHNHPSGVAEPSHADTRITNKLTDALALLDIRLLDHIVIGGMTHVSFADRGLL